MSCSAAKFAIHITPRHGKTEVFHGEHLGRLIDRALTYESYWLLNVDALACRPQTCCHFLLIVSVVCLKFMTHL